MIEKLRQLKKKSHMTNQQIAEKSNIPESTVARIFSGKTPNPTIATVISMTRAMGGSVADLLITGTEDELSEISEAEMQDCGKEVAVDKSPAISEFGSDVQVPRQAESPAACDKIYEEIIELYRIEMKKKDVCISRLFWCMAGIMLFILFVLIFDILNPGFGFVKY
mgnify:CR=1 FL=1